MIADTPPWTALIASGSISRSSFALLTIPAHAWPPAAALAMPEKSGVGENEMLSSSLVDAAP